MEAAQKMEGKIDVSIVGPQPGRKPRRVSRDRSSRAGTLPVEYVTIDTPALDQVAGVKMKVLIEPSIKIKHDKTIWVQMTPTTICYLHAAVMEQLRSEAIHNRHPRKAHGDGPLGVRGLSRVYNGKNKGKYRLVDARLKNVKSQLLRAATDTDALAQAKALTFSSTEDLLSAVSNQGDEEDAISDGGK